MNININNNNNINNSINDYNNISNNNSSNINQNNNNNYLNYNYNIINQSNTNNIKNNNTYSSQSSFNSLGYNNTNNLYNLPYDINANPFIPKNIIMNPNINNIPNNTNDYLLPKSNQSWICSFCHNYNSRSKYYIINFKFKIIEEQICNKCGNLDKNINNQNFGSYSSSNLPFVFPFENIYPPFSPINSSSGGLNNINMNNSEFYRLSNQNEKFNSSKNTKKNKKLKKYKEKRPFDWICNRCNNLNYSFRNFCNICNLPRSENQSYNSNMRNNSS